MSQEKAPSFFHALKQSHPGFIDAVDRLGQAVREQGPLDNKTAHLVQMAAAAAIRSEGAVHSHVRRALEAGASVEEVRHSLMLLTSTIGFPTVVAALSWIEDVLGQD